jgi:nitroreductase
MALAAHSLGLGSYWTAIFNLENAQGSLEEKVKNVLKIPDQIRVMAILPIGIPAYSKEGERRWLRDVPRYDEWQTERGSSMCLTTDVWDFALLHIPAVLL